MAQPDNYVVGSGLPVYAGRAAPGNPGGSGPLWAQNAPLNAWKQINGTSGSAGASTDEFSGFALVNQKLVAAASGGHHVSDNRVVAIDLSQDAPTWGQLNAASAFSDVVPDASYNADGKPNSRHTRYNIQYMPGVNGGRVMLLGARDLYTATSPGSKKSVDGFNLNSTPPAWDAAGTYADVPGTVGIPDGSAYVDGGAFVDANGDGWTYGGTIKFDKTLKTWSRPLTAEASNRVRYPWCTAQARGLSFGMNRGDGFGGAGLNAIKQVGNVQTQITFNASAALTQLMADSAYEAGMAYDEINDYFLFYGGNVGGQIYKVTPNNTNVWDVSLFSYGAGNDMPPASVANTQSRIQYIPAYKGFVLLPAKAGNLYFMRTA